MSQLNKMQFVVLDDQGRPISGASIKIHFQGATVNGTQAGPAYNVNSPGAIEPGADVYSSVNLTFTRTVSAVTATNVTAGAIGLGTLSDDDRILYALPLPVIYNDAEAGETKTNPLTTDASGTAFCWVPASKYDIVTTAAGYNTRFEYDRVAEGSETIVSNIFTSGTAVAFSYATRRNLTTAGAKLANWINSGTEKAFIDKDGDIDTDGDLHVSGSAVIDTNLTVTGNQTVTGDITVDDITADDISCDTLTAGTGLTLSGGTLTLPAGSVETADLATNAVVVTRTADGTADQNINSSAYANANYTNITNCTLTFTPASTSSEIVIMATSPGEANAGAIAECVSAIRDGSDNILHETSVLTGGTTGDPVNSSLHYRVTGLSGSQTFKLSVQFQRSNGRVNNSTHAAKKRISRITALEFKK